ncbi:MAG: stage II sporulation protein R [Clostridia bacterium]|nr:stage II sporulation protein R [Clostridia bacterium]
MKTRNTVLLVFLLLSILFIFFVYSLAKSYSDYVFNNLSHSFVRFHVVANSNSTEDQIIKYKVRDEIMNYASSLLINANSQAEALKILSDHLDELSAIAESLITSENLNYSVRVSIGKSYFPTKDYNSFILPEGNYDALKVELGDAQGQNWWCVMFPSICIPQYDDINISDNSVSLLENTLDTEELSIISKNSNSANVKIKFKLIELFENI